MTRPHWKLSFTLLVLASLGLVIFFANLPSSAQQIAPPVYFESTSTYESVFAGGNGIVSYEYCAGKFGRFGFPACYDANGNAIPPYFASSTQGSLNINKPGLTVNMSFATASAQISFQGKHEWVDAPLSSPYGEYWTRNVDNTTKVYVRGIPGTPFHLEYSYSESVEAIVLQQSCTNVSISANVQGQENPGVNAHDVGQSVSASKSGAPPAIEGITEGETKTYLGQVYSLAYTFGRAGSVYTQDGPGCSPPKFTGSSQFDGSLHISAYVRCNGQFPIATIAGPSSVGINQSAHFDGSGSHDPDGNIIEYKWTIQDLSGQVVSNGPTVNHTWNTLGTYQVSLTVTDNDGQTGTAANTVIVNAQPTPTAALDLHEQQVESKKGASQSKSGAFKLKKEVEEMGLKLEPVHPGQTHPLLAPYFMIEVPDRQTAESVIERLVQNEIVEAAYLRPEDTAP